MDELKKGQIIKCEVTGITNYGVFVKLPNGYDGLVHISELSDKYVNSVKKLYIEGDYIEAKVLEIDDEKKQVKLSIKKNKVNTKTKKSIEEKGKGFEPLKENLEKWIQEKLNDLNKSKTS